MTKDSVIKRYLSSISDSNKQSSSFGTNYYIIKYESKSIKIRFSDHFGNDKADIDIIKQAEFYIIKFLGISYPCNSDNVLLYLKSILLLYPEISTIILKYAKAYNTIKVERDKLLNESKLNKDIVETAQLYLSEYEELKKYKQTINDLKYNLNRTQDNLTKKKVELNDVQQRYNSLLCRVKEIENIIKKIK